MSKENSTLCEFLPWDSDFFRCRIARIRGDTLNEEQAQQIDLWSLENRIRCLYFLSRADEPGTIRTAERHGFSLVDIRLTFEHGALGRQPVRPAQAAPETLIRPATPEDLPALQTIARTGYEDTRFFRDPHFPRELAAALYTTWVTQECQGRAQQVLVAAADSNEAVGYVSCHLDSRNRSGQIGLVGVSRGFRGNGLGRKLVLAALDWCAAHGAREVTVVTQGTNRSAQRLYQRCGFLTRDLQLWHHKWYLPTPTNDA